VELSSVKGISASQIDRDLIEGERGISRSRVDPIGRFDWATQVRRPTAIPSAFAARHNGPSPATNTLGTGDSLSRREVRRVVTAKRVQLGQASRSSHDRVGGSNRVHLVVELFEDNDRPMEGRSADPPSSVRHGACGATFGVRKTARDNPLGFRRKQARSLRGGLLHQ
jgi:hypothetical protein